MVTVPTQFTTVSSILDAIVGAVAGPFVGPEQSANALRSRIVELRPTPDNLLTALVDYHASLICQPAREALSDYLYGRVRTVAGRLVNAGRLDDARRYVALQIEVTSVAAEATRHMHHSECARCPDLWQHCDVLEALESREDALHHQIAALGGF